MKLFYKEPAAKWEEILPIGNGALGGMIWGGIKKEQIGLNEDTLWSGYYHDKNNHDAIHYLPETRKLILEGKYAKAENLIRKHMLGEYNESYLPLGNLFFEFEHGEKVTDYVRTLDIAESTVAVSYNVDGIQYKREYFASYPAKAIFVKLSCNKRQMNTTISFQSELKHMAQYCSDGIVIRGKCPEHIDPSYIHSNPVPVIQGERGMEFEAVLRILKQDGVIETKEQAIKIKDASSIILAFSAVKKSEYDLLMDYEEIKRIHRADYQSIYNKVELYLGEQQDTPTNVRLENLRKGVQDNGLYALYFQYARYLLISSSRTGSMPSNLQGIWSWEFRAPWSSNWTTNINLQMNYWLAQSCNLQECMDPYFEFLKRICEEGKKTARIHYNCRGFVHHHNADYWCNTNPVGLASNHSEGEEGSVTWSFWPMGGAWMTSELFKHYEYNQDLKFLGDTAYPLLREAALFLIDWLFENEGMYITCPSTSPENRFWEDEKNHSCVARSSAMDLAIIREVFDHFKKTCEVLDIQDDILVEIDERLQLLAPFQIGSYGQLLEWHEEFKEVEPGHRHISHLYGLFPSELFGDNKELTEACRISLLHRLEHGGGHTGWSCAWIINMFSILGDTKNAYEYLHTLLTRSTYDNLWDSHPPFQIDGNFGGAAGIANMLVQDRNGELKILPALPAEFQEGYVKGLRIKSGKSIDISWKKGELVDYRVY